MSLLRRLHVEPFELESMETLESVEAALAQGKSPALLPAPAFALAVVLLLAFAGAIAVVLRRGVQASCRCFGGSGAAPFRPHHIVRNLVLVAVAVTGLVAVLAGPALTWEAVALGAVPGVVVALLVTRLDDLVALFSPTPVGRR